MSLEDMGQEVISINVGLKLELEEKRKYFSEPELKLEPKGAPINETKPEKN